MRNRVTYEIWTGVQYLLIGIIAEIAVARWVRRDGGDVMRQVAAWFLIATALSLVRFAIIVIASLLRRDQWQTISRRNWI